MENRFNRDILCKEKYWENGAHDAFGPSWGEWLGQFSSLCSYTSSFLAFNQVLWYRAPNPHFTRPGAGPASFENLARSAGSGDLGAEGTEGTVGTSSKSG